LIALSASKSTKRAPSSPSIENLLGDTGESIAQNGTVPLFLVLD
jgi:hypothetical protein